MNGLASSGLISMDEASCIESTEAGRLMSVFYLDLETMKHIMKINGSETLERLLWVVCESHELADMHLRVDERRVLNALNRNNAAQTIRYPMKGKITTRQMKLNCIIQAILGCLPITEPSLNQEAMKVMRIAVRVCKCLVTYVTRPALISLQPKYYLAVLNSVILAKCVEAHLWENSPFVSKQLKGIGPTFSTLLATAGKVNFMLLEESHPRDLERIMNKGAPAGNVLRKQITLLPKYQLTMTPIDEISVTIELVLLNKNYLAENSNNLTAGDSHKSYIIVGDSENNLVLLTSFKDKDLISLYDGVITHEIKRKLNFEHKMYAHCVSSSFVGIDVQYEYLFKDLEIPCYPSHLSTNADRITKVANKQTTITDTFKERKRKNTSEIDLAQSKEKKKRDNALLDKLNNLKDSFGKASNELKKGLDKSSALSNSILHEFTHNKNSKMCIEVSAEKHNKATIEPSTRSEFNHTMLKRIDSELSEVNDVMDDERINSLLCEIENERIRNNSTLHQPILNMKDTQHTQSSLFRECSFNAPQRYNNIENYKAFNNNTKIKHSQKHIKSNYNFIDLLEKDINFSDEEENRNVNKPNSFPDTIKNQIEKYLQNTKAVSNVQNQLTVELLGVDNRDNHQEIESKSNDQNILKDKSASGDQTYQNQVASVLKNQTNVNTNTAATQNHTEDTSLITNNGQVTTEKQTDDVHDKITNMNLSNKINKTVAVGKDSRPNKVTNYITEKPFLTQDTKVLTKNTCNLYRSYNTRNSLEANNSIAFNDVSDLNLFENNKISNRLNINISHYLDQTEEATERNIPAPDPALLCSQLQKFDIPENQGNDKHVLGEHNNKNICLKPISSTMILDVNSNPEKCMPSTAITHNNSNNTTKQNTNIRKYSYSTTKIDVATKNIPGHVVRVIRKMKMDLDITEIISPQNEEHQIHDDFKQNMSNSKASLCKENKYLNSVLPKCHTADYVIKHSKASYPNHSINDVAIFNDIPKTLPEKHYVLIPKLPKIATMSRELSIQPKQMPIQQITCGFDTKSVRDENDKVDLEDKLSKIRENTKKQDGYTFKSIIQKYSQALSKNTKSANLSQSLTQPKRLDKDSFNALPKSKRPFKITDINKVNIILPKTLIGETTKQEDVPEIEDIIEQEEVYNNHQIEKNEKNCYLGDTRTQTNTFEKPEQGANRYIAENKNIPYIRQSDELWENFDKVGLMQNEDSVDNFDEDLATCKLLTRTAEKQQPEQIEVHADISQSMLNPKTLLQSLNNDCLEDIVPPPPQFRDESGLISSPTFEDVNEIPTDCYEPLNWNDNYDKALGSFNDNSNVYDSSRVKLTPGNELETWTLSQNDESYENLAESTSFTPAQSFTIMRDSGQHRSLLKNVSATRQNRLAQFKFCRK